MILLISSNIFVTFVLRRSDLLMHGYIFSLRKELLISPINKLTLGRTHSDIKAKIIPDMNQTNYILLLSGSSCVFSYP